MRGSVLLLVALGISGCAIGRQAENEPLEPTRIARLVPGETTAAEVVETMGAPTDVVQLGRRSAYLYRHVQKATTGIVLVVLNLFNQDQREDRLWVFFDEAGTLTHVGSTLRADETRFAAPWQDLYDDPPEEEPAP